MTYKLGCEVQANQLNASKLN